MGLATNELLSELQDKLWSGVQVTKVIVSGLCGRKLTGWIQGWLCKKILSPKPEFGKRRMGVGGRKRRKGKKWRQELEKRGRYLETRGPNPRELAQRAEAAESLFPRSRWCEPCRAGWRCGL